MVSSLASWKVVIYIHLKLIWFIIASLTVDDFSIDFSHLFLFGFRFCQVRGCRPGKSVQMTEAEVRGLCLKSREIFLQQPILLELEAPLKICGEERFLSLLCADNCSS